MPITFEQHGNFSKTKKFLQLASHNITPEKLITYAEEGLRRLRDATPEYTGLTADSWYYTIEESDGTLSINYKNSNVGGAWAPIAILLQYGHGTGTGGWVEGIDYINPALKPVFDKIAKNTWEEVINN